MESSFLQPIKIHFQRAEEKEFYRDLKKEKQIQLNKDILKDFLPLRKKIEIFIQEIDESLNDITVEEPTLDERNSYDYYHNYKVAEKVQLYRNHKDVNDWNNHLKNTLNRLSNDNIRKETGYAWSSYFSREIIDISDKIKWIKTMNSFKNFTVIKLPTNTDDLINESKEYIQKVKYKNEIIEDECLKEYLAYKEKIRNKEMI